MANALAPEPVMAVILSTLSIVKLPIASNFFVRVAGRVSLLYIAPAVAFAALAIYEPPSMVISPAATRSSSGLVEVEATVLVYTA